MHDEFFVIVEMVPHRHAISRSRDRNRIGRHWSLAVVAFLTTTTKTTTVTKKKASRFGLAF